METNENKSIKTQIEIVKSLLDGSNKPQRQIANEIGKEESTVSKALGYLVKDNVVAIDPKIIYSGKHNKGMYKNNLCCLNYELNNGLHILKFLRCVFSLESLRKKDINGLVSVLQNNNKILDMLQDIHPEFRGRDIEITPAMREAFKYNTTDFRPYADKVNTLEDVLNFKPLIVPFLEAQNQAFKDDFKKYLRESPTFFKMCLLHDSEDLKDKAEGVHFGFLAAIVYYKEKVKALCDSASGYSLGCSFYWFCCIVDALEL
jgi:DNA-binding Lrp family transcriptional regulator